MRLATERTATLALALALAPLAAWAEGEPPPGPAPAQPKEAPKPPGSPGAASPAPLVPLAEIPRADREFLETARQRGLYALELHRLASSTLEPPELASFAREAAAANEGLASELDTFAAARGLALPQVMTKKDAARIEKMKGWSRAELEDEYLEEAIDCARQDARMFQRYAKDARSPELRTFASSSARLLERQEATARDLERQLERSARR